MAGLASNTYRLLKVTVLTKGTRKGAEGGRVCSKTQLQQWSRSIPLLLRPWSWCTTASIGDAVIAGTVVGDGYR